MLRVNGVTQVQEHRPCFLDKTRLGLGWNFKDRVHLRKGVEDLGKDLGPKSRYGKDQGNCTKD